MPRESRLSLILIVLIVCAFLAAPAGATSVLYTDRITWEAATSGIFTIDFEGLATAAIPGNYSTAGGYTMGGLQFIGLTPPGSYYLYAQDPAGSQNYTWGSGDVLMGPNAAWGGGYIQVNMPSGGVTSFGTNIMTHTPFAAQIVGTLSTGDTRTVNTFSNPNPAFVGFTSDAPITFVRLAPVNGAPMIDNFSYGAAAQETPEADSLILGGVGLLGILLGRRVRRLAA